MPPKQNDWIPCTTPRKGDMVKWVEPIFAPPNKAKTRGKPKKIGDQQVTALILSEGEFFECEVIEVIKVGGNGNTRVAEGDVIRRRPDTFKLGNCKKKIVTDS